MRANLRFILLSATLVFCFSAMIFGQQTSGTIEGTVRDPQGAVIPGASVTVQGVTAGFNRTVQANEEGFYRIQQVPPGRYKVSVAAINGFSATDLENIQVVIEKITTADVKLGITQNVSTVDINSDPTGVTVDATESKIQTNVTSQLIELIPKSESFTSLLKISPATRSEPTAGGFQVDGASGAENAFIIDGQEVTNFRTGTLNSTNNIPTSLVQELQIKTSGFEAEHGGASGGVVVVSTKGGTDQWRGEFGMQFVTSRLQPGPRSVDQVYQKDTSTQILYNIRQPRDKYLNFFPTGTLGGPIVKGKVWFLGSYSPQIYETTRRTTYYLNNSSFNATNLKVNDAFAAEDYTSKNTYNYAFGRIDASPTNSLRFFASYLWNPTVYEGVIPFNAIAVGSSPSVVTLGGTTYRGAQYNRFRGGRDNANTFNSQGVWTPNSKLVITGRFGYSFLNEKGTSAYAIPNLTRFACLGVSAAYTGVATGCSLNFQNVTSNNLINFDVSTRKTFNVDASYFINNLGGRHNLKGGYEYGTVFNNVSTGYINTGISALYYGRDYSYLGVSGTRDPSTTLGVGYLERFGTQGTASNKYQALYIQDKWTINNRLTLNLGVRAETENLPAFNTGNGNAGIPLEFGWGDKITPRLGFAYDPFGDGKTRIFGSYGTFTDRVRFSLPRGSFGGDFYRFDVFPILKSHPEYSYYTPAVILGSFKDPVGGGNPLTAGGLSIQQYDYRIPSNLPPSIYAGLGLPLGATDPNLKPYSQREITFGVERELSKIFVLTARYTNKTLLHVVEDQANIGLFESESFIIGNVGEGLAYDVRKAAGITKQTKAQREYNALEISLDKRLSNNYYFNVNYTFSKLYGNYSGLASSDEVSATTGLGRANPGVTRYFDYPVNGYTAFGDPDNGRLPTDRPHVLKAYGGYTFDWWKNKTNSTDFGFFTQLMSGTPQTTYINVGTTTVIWKGRGDLGRTEAFSQTDLNLTHRYRFGRDNRFTMALDFNVLNVFNENNAISLYNTRYINTNALAISDIDPTFDSDTMVPTNAFNLLLNGKIGPQLAVLENDPTNRSTVYGKPNFYQALRQVRFGFRLLF